VLTEQQRLRYNQLQALYFNEQIMFFEIAIDETYWKHCFAIVVAATHKVAPVLEEEQQHTEMFRRLNQHCAPQFYRAGHYYFIQPPRAWMAVLNWATQHPRFFPHVPLADAPARGAVAVYSRRVIAHAKSSNSISSRRIDAPG